MGFSRGLAGRLGRGGGAATSVANPCLLGSTASFPWCTSRRRRAACAWPPAAKRWRKGARGPLASAGAAELQSVGITWARCAVRGEIRCGVVGPSLPLPLWATRVLRVVWRRVRGCGGGRARLGARRFSVAAARPTRLETRTKESAGCASRRVIRNLKAKRKRRSDLVPLGGRAQGRPR